jgi:hypothetical protein
MVLLLIIILLLLALGGGGWAYPRYGASAFGLFILLLFIFVVLWVVGALALPFTVYR